MQVNTYYLRNIPESGDIVFATLSDETCSDKGFYMNLLEYNNTIGFVLQTEVAKKLVDYRKTFRSGKIYALLVLNSEEKNGRVVIDLSYKKIKEEDRPALETKYIFISKLNMLIHDLIKLKLWDDRELYEETFLRLIPSGKDANANNVELIYNEILKKCETLFSADTKISQDVVEKYLDHLRKHITISPVEMYKEINVIILESNAINKIKEIFDVNMLIPNTTIEYHTAPFYRINTIGIDETKCKENINALIDAIKAKASKYSLRMNTDGEYVTIKEQSCFYKKSV